MKAKTEDYIEKNALVATTDPKLDNPVYRRPGFEEILTPPEMDEKITNALRAARIDKDLARTELAPLLGFAEAVYGRYERGLTKLHATQILQVCEVLRIFPDDLLFDAAPHLWGDDRTEAEQRRRITKLIQQLPRDTLDTVTTVLDAMLSLQSAVPATTSELAPNGSAGRSSKRVRDRA
jgi:transcriptional regulator with XRE-family HTH domain